MEAAALRVAVELMLMPSRARHLRDAALPDGVALLLRIAAGDASAEREAVAASERPIKVVREASTFFIEQMLLHPDADSYRVLGVNRTAPATELRQHMALLMRWLHPDTNRAETRGIFVNRVNRAWDDLKTPDRRLAYDTALASKTPSPSRSMATRGDGRRPNDHQRPTGHRPPRVTTFKKRALRASDLMAPLKGGRNLLRRAFRFFRRPGL